jgi:hypothetical protein
MTEEEFKAKLAGRLKECIEGFTCYASPLCERCWVFQSCAGSNRACGELPKHLQKPVFIYPSRAFFRAYLEGKVALHNGQWVEVIDE